MMQDIKRICLDPTEEDQQWFPDIAGCDDWRGTLRDAWAHYRDESFIKQFLSPHLIRKFRLFVLADDADDDHFTVSGIHNEQGYQMVREVLARRHDVSAIEPDIQVVDVDLRGDRTLHLTHTMHNAVPLAERNRDQVLGYLKRLWGYEVNLVGVDAASGKTLYRAGTGNESDGAGD